MAWTQLQEVKKLSSGKEFDAVGFISDKPPMAEKRATRPEPLEPGVARRVQMTREFTQLRSEIVAESPSPPPGRNGDADNKTRDGAQTIGVSPPAGSQSGGEIARDIELYRQQLVELEQLKQQQPEDVPVAPVGLATYPLRPSILRRVVECFTTSCVCTGRELYRADWGGCGRRYRGLRHRRQSRN